MADVKGFTFGESYYTTISDPENDLSEEQKAQLYKAMIDYVFTGEKPQFKGILKVIFTALLPSLEKSKVRSKAKQNKIKQKTKQNQNENKEERKNSFDFVEEKAPSIKENITTPKEDIIISPPISPRNAQERFFQEFPTVIVDNYDSATLANLSEEDWDLISEQFRKSEWLKKNVKTLSFLCNLSKRILAGQYAPFEKGENKNDEDVSAEERRQNAEWFERMFERGQ